MEERGNFGRTEVPGRRWIDQIRFAFMEASGGNEKLQMNYEQWMKSRFRYLIEQREVTDTEMNMFYKKMDENNDGFITWDELILFMNSKINSFPGNTTKHLGIDYEAPEDPSPILEKGINPPFQTIYLQKKNEIVTMSKNQIVFWDLNDCSVIQVINSENLVAMQFIPSFNQLAVIKSSPEICFIDANTYEFTTNVILPNESLLANIPSSSYIDRDENLLIGFEDGHIESIKINKNNNTVTAKLNSSFTHHGQKVSKILWIDDENCYLSSSYDKYLVMFTNESILYKINVNYSITNIVYDSVSRNVFFATDDHYFGYWRTLTSVFKIKDLEQTKLVNLFVVSLSKRKSLLIATNTENFYMTWKLPEIVSIGNWLYEKQCENTSSGIVLSSCIYLVGSFLSKWRINLTVHTDKIFDEPLVGITYAGHHSPNHLLTISNKAECIFWNYFIGNVDHRQNITYGSEVLCWTIDETHTRLCIAMADDRFITINAVNGHHISNCSLGFSDNPTTHAIHCRVDGKPRLLIVENSQMLLYEDQANGQYMYVRNYQRVKSPFKKIFVIKGRYYISFHEDNQIFMWEFNDTLQKLTFSIPTTATCLCDIDSSEDNFLIGGEDGNIYVMSVNQNTPVFSFSGFKMKIKNSITCITSRNGLYAVSNDSGYVKVFSINEDIEEVAFFRAHSRTVDSICFVKDDKLMISSEGHVSMFALNPPMYIGELGFYNTWDAEGQSAWKKCDFIAQFDISQFEDASNNVIKVEELTVREPSMRREDCDIAPRYIEDVPPLNIGAVMNMIHEIDQSDDDDFGLSNSAKNQKVQPLTTRPRIVRPSLPKHPLGLPLFHSDGNQTIKIVETARQYKQIKLPDRRIKTGRTYAGVRFNV